VLDVAGVPTSYGSRSVRTVPAVHAAALRRLLDAGAVVFGKTNLPEFGLKGVSDSAAFGRVANPWDPARTAGGSSGGSAAAVAAGVVPMAGGNDGGGSLRIPAACCGLFALKPSRGRISNGPGLGEVWFGACTEGVITRSVRDTALALDVLCGPEPGDPFVTAPPPGFVGALQTPVRRLRVAFSTASPLGTPVDAEAVAAVCEAALLLEGLGHQVEEAAPAIAGDAVAQAYLQLYFAQVPAMVDEALAAGASTRDIEWLTRLTATLGRATGAGKTTTWLLRWNGFARTLAGFYARHDVWLTPTLAAPPLRHGALDPPPAQRRLLQGLMASGLLGLLARTGWLQPVIDGIARENLTPYPFTQLANLTGTPAMSLPLHRTAAGLPLGVHVGAALGDEVTLLQLAAELEQARPWFDDLPPIARAAG
jgi:amidase